jgi:hypothetical protein
LIFLIWIPGNPIHLNPISIFIGEIEKPYLSHLKMDGEDDGFDNQYYTWLRIFFNLELLGSYIISFWGFTVFE